MRRILVPILTVALLLFAAQRLPAPIQEIPETATPAPEQSAKPKPRTSPKAKPKPKASASPTSPATQAPSAKKPSRFAGTWVGTIPGDRSDRFRFSPAMAIYTILTVDPTEATMSHTWTGNPPTDVAKTEIVGDTIRATFHANVQSGEMSWGEMSWAPATFTFSVTPWPDGVTASVRLLTIVRPPHAKAFMNDNTAVFHRVGKLAPR